MLKFLLYIFINYKLIKYINGRFYFVIPKAYKFMHIKYYK